MKEKKSRQALIITLLFLLFPIAGIFFAVFYPEKGLGMVAPLLLGPGILVLLWGLSFDYSLGPVLGISGEFSREMKKAFILLGGLFLFMGIVALMFV